MKRVIFVTAVSACIISTVKAQSGAPYLELAKREAEQKEYKSALKYIDSALQVDPKNQDAFMMRGIIKLRLGNYNGAIADEDAAIKLDAKNYKVYLVKGLIEEQSNKFDNAILNYNKAIEADPSKREPYMRRGLMYFRKNQIDLARSDWNHANKLEFETIYDKIDVEPE